MKADKIFHNADISTLWDERPEASALAVVKDRILAVGNMKEFEHLSGPETELVDLGGCFVLPGFIESHNHASAYAMNTMRVDCSSPGNASIKDVLAAISKKAKETPPGEWIQGFGFDDTLIDDKRHLTRKDLDEAAPDHPVQVMHISVHFSYVNTKAMLIAGLDGNTAQPEGGEIHFDESGSPSGLMIEAGAMDLVRRHVPLYTCEQMKEALKSSFEYFHSAGITSIHDAGIGYFQHGPQVVRAYQELAREDNLKLRVYMTIVEDLYRSLVDLGLRSGFGSDFLKLGSIKTWQDGSIQGLTGALKEPYYSKPDYLGDLLIPQEDLDGMVEKYHVLGQQMAIHANGDRAIESVVLAFEKAFEKCPLKDRRHMIIHCQMVSDGQLGRMKRIGLIPHFFVNHVYYWGDRHKSIFIGPERAARLDPLSSACNLELDFCLHSDLPVTPASPVFSMHTAVNRLTGSGEVLGPDQRIGIIDALKAYTTTAAYVGFEENDKGMLRPGLLADFVVLSDNLVKVDSGNIKNVEVLETYLGGDMVYRR